MPHGSKIIRMGRYGFFPHHLPPAASLHTALLPHRKSNAVFTRTVLFSSSATNSSMKTTTRGWSSTVKSEAKEVMSEARKHFKQDTSESLGKLPRYIIGGVLIVGGVGLYIDNCITDRKSNLDWLRNEEEWLQNQLSEILKILETDAKFMPRYIAADERGPDSNVWLELTLIRLSLKRIDTENIYLQERMDLLEKEIKESYFPNRLLQKNVLDKIAKIKKEFKFQSDVNTAMHSCTLGTAFCNYGFYSEAEIMLEPILPTMKKLGEGGEGKATALFLKGQHFRISHALGIIKHALGKYEEALSYFDSILAMNPKGGYTLGAKARLLTDMGKHEEALECYKNALSYCQDPLLFSFYAIALQRQKRNIEALHLHNKACKMGENNPIIFNNRAWFLYETKGDVQSLEKALEDANKAISLWPSSASYYHTKACILDKMQRYQEAFENMEAANNIEPQKYSEQLKSLEEKIEQERRGLHRSLR